MPGQFRVLLDVQKLAKPYVSFLSESHLGRVKAEKLRRRVGFDHLLIHESDGRSGGLLMMWKKEVNIQVNDISKYFIDVSVHGETVWRLTGIYGEPSWEHKEATWEVLRTLHGIMTMPWLVLGDFNEILYNHEKDGGRPRTQKQLHAFHDALSACQLSDLGFEWDKFTWQRGKIRERLDRGVVNVQWRQLFPNASLTNSEMTKSDHRPIVVETEEVMTTQERGNTRRFEARWLKEGTV